MPNQMNIDQPIALVGAGRSGTTLLTNVFRVHPECESLGETGDLLYSSYYNLCTTLPICGPFFTPDNASSHARGAVHAMLRSLASSDRPHWFHKPILIPSARCFFDDDDSFLSWWWSAYETLSPDACTFTVLREPHDVIASSMIRWSYSREEAIEHLTLLYHWLLRDDSRCQFAIRFEDLIESPEATVRWLMERVGLTYYPACLRVFDHCYAPNDSNGSLDTLEKMSQRGHRHPGAHESDIGKTLPELYSRLIDRYCQSTV